MTDREALPSTAPLQNPATVGLGEADASVGSRAQAPEPLSIASQVAQQETRQKRCQDSMLDNTVSKWHFNCSDKSPS